MVGSTPLSIASFRILLHVMLCAVLQVYRLIFRPRWFLRNIRGPSEDTAFLTGHMDIIDLLPAGERHADWHAQYGPVFTFDGYFKVRDAIPKSALSPAQT